MTPARNLNCIPRWGSGGVNPTPAARSSSSVHPHARTPSALTAADRGRTAMWHACRAPCARAGRGRPSGAPRCVHGCAGAHPSRRSSNRIEVWSASSVSVSAAMQITQGRGQSCADAAPSEPSRDAVVRASSCCGCGKACGGALAASAALGDSMAASGAVGSACRGTRPFLRCHSQRTPSR